MIRVLANKVNLFGHKYTVQQEDGEFIVRVYERSGIVILMEKYEDAQAAMLNYKALIRVRF